MHTDVVTAKIPRDLHRRLRREVLNGDLRARGLTSKSAVIELGIRAALGEADALRVVCAREHVQV